MDTSGPLGGGTAAPDAAGGGLPRANGTAAAPPGDARRTPRLVPLQALLGEWEAFATSVHEARVRGVARGPVSGIAPLDQELGGVLQPGLHVVHGGPGVGKTAFALQIAGTCGFPALYVTAEMRLLELLARITARVTNTYLGRLKSGELAPADSLARVRQAVAAVPRLALADATEAFLAPGLLRDFAQAVRGDADHVLIAVDSVHSWADGGPDVLDEYERLNAGLAALRTVAGQLGCPVLAVAERNRLSMKSGGLSASAGSRKFEYGAESVWDLSVPEKDAPPVALDEASVVLHVVKNRNGAAGRRVPLVFHGALQRFTEA